MGFLSKTTLALRELTRADTSADFVVACSLCGWKCIFAQPDTARDGCIFSVKWLRPKVSTKTASFCFLSSQSGLAQKKKKIKEREHYTDSRCRQRKARVCKPHQRAQSCQSIHLEDLESFWLVDQCSSTPIFLPDKNVTKGKSSRCLLKICASFHIENGNDLKSTNDLGDRMRISGEHQTLKWADFWHGDPAARFGQTESGINTLVALPWVTAIVTLM